MMVKYDRKVLRIGYLVIFVKTLTIWKGHDDNIIVSSAVKADTWLKNDVG
jgi:hypothetical protein